jgi:hypothetical protein
MLGSVAAPTKEHLDEIEQEHLRINSTFNKKQRQRTKGQHQYYNMPREFDVRRKWPQCARIINIIQVRDLKDLWLKFRIFCLFSMVNFGAFPRLL